MACIKLEDLDKENPNYQFLKDGLDNGKIQIDETNCTANIKAAELEIKFSGGMKAYLITQGYSVTINGK